MESQSPGWSFSSILGELHPREHDTTESKASAEETIGDLDKISDMEDKVDYVVHQLKMQTLSQLWHQRLGHIHPETVSKMLAHASGVPKLSRPTVIDNCPICIAAKMQKSNASSANSRIATTCFQGLSIDFAFIVGKSKNSNRFIVNLGMNGETCYVLLVNHFSGMVFGKTFQTKAPPIKWRNQWLAHYTPNAPDKTVHFDQGGKLGRCRTILDLFKNFGYSIELTGTDASHQNGSVERTHKTIGNMMRTLLNGADLSRKF
jgi:GAG-pre-integrase domain